MKNALLLASCFILICGCAETQKVVLDSTIRPPTPSVEVYKDGRLPERKHKEIGEFSWKGPRQDELRAQRFFMKEAKKMGGDAIIFLVASSEMHAEWGIGGKVSNDWLFKAKVISYDKE